KDPIQQVIPPGNASEHGADLTRLGQGSWRGWSRARHGNDPKPSRERGRSRRWRAQTFAVAGGREITEVESPNLRGSWGDGEEGRPTASSGQAEEADDAEQKKNAAQRMRRNAPAAPPRIRDWEP